MVDFSKVKTYPLNSRKNKVEAKNFSSSDSNLLSKIIPDILIGKDLKELVGQIRAE